GLANVDISPELAVRLSLAWASTFEKGATVTASRDTSRAARVLKRAIMVGCNAAGINVDDLEAATVPVTRFQITTTSSLAGISVRLVPDDPQSVVLRFFDKEGLDVDEATQRRIERLYHREDFRRVLAREIGDIGFPPRALEYYTAALVESVDLSNARDAELKLVLDYSFGTASFVMPNLLAKLEAEVLAVNPYANTASVLTFDRQASAARVSELVRASGAHLGAVLDPGGEHLAVVDDLGHALSDDEALLVLLTLVTAAHPGARVALPVAASRAAEEICRRAGADIVWTKLSASHLMEVARSQRITMAASQSGGFIFPHFLPAYDAAATLVNLLALLAPTGRKLSELVAELPAVHIAHQAVHTPWDQKGMVMRTLVERSQGRDLVLVDGVKIMEVDGWALVLPDPEEPLTHIWVEGPNDAEALARAQEYAVRLEQLVR
ncbi:MAG: mannose-1-phosphate guanyltransferase, partial [Acidimicrobiales bacterium]